jgi:hypothetical protein
MVAAIVVFGGVGGRAGETVGDRGVVDGADGGEAVF